MNFIAEPVWALAIHLHEKTVSKAYIKITQYQIGEEAMPLKNGRALLSRAIQTERVADLR